jgi:uroporphyrinogen decarboxylase
MNSRERVQAAIARQPVDQVPLGFYAVDHDTVANVLGRPSFVRNKIAIQLALWDGRREELVDGLKKDTVEFYQKIDCADLIIPKEAMLLPPKDYEPNPPKKIADEKWEDAEGRIFQAVEHANEIGIIHDPQAGARQFSVADFAVPLDTTPPDESVFEVFDYVFEKLGHERYFASYSGGITAFTLLGDTESGLLQYALQPEVIQAANRQSVAWQNAMDPFYIRDGVPGVLMEQDMAGTNGPMISPQMFRELGLPWFKARVQHVKQFGKQLIFHNCGNNLPLMDFFVEAGVDCYQSLQTNAGMEVGYLKEKYGDRLCFWGGVPVELLITGTPNEIRQAVRTALERGAPGGGFILGPSHSIAKNTKYENFMAMLDEFVRLRDKY